jgi:hypothetical protein
MSKAHDDLIDELEQQARVLDAKAQSRVLSSELRGRFSTSAALTRGRAARLRAGSPVVVSRGATSASRGIFSRYDDNGLRAALADPELRGRDRRQAERVARSRGL